MVAEGVAGGPVGDIGVNPVPKEEDIVTAVFSGEGIHPVGGDLCLLLVAGGEEFLAEGVYLRFRLMLHLFPGFLCDAIRGGGLHAVAEDTFFEEPLGTLLYFRVGVLSELFADAGDEGGP